MNPGDRCISQYSEWHTAFGDPFPLALGQRLTVKGRRNFAGALFYQFEETPEDCLYLSTGFKPLRNLN